MFSLTITGREKVQSLKKFLVSICIYKTLGLAMIINWMNISYQFSQAVVVDRTMYISGQLGMDTVTGQLVAGGVQAQAKQVRWFCVLLSSIFILLNMFNGFIFTVYTYFFLSIYIFCISVLYLFLNQRPWLT